MLYMCGQLSLGSFAIRLHSLLMVACSWNNSLATSWHLTFVCMCWWCYSLNITISFPLYHLVSLILLCVQDVGEATTSAYHPLYHYIVLLHTVRLGPPSSGSWYRTWFRICLFASPIFTPEHFTSVYIAVCSPKCSLFQRNIPSPCWRKPIIGNRWKQVRSCCTF